jgi:hypothetical protein
VPSSLHSWSWASFKISYAAQPPVRLTVWERSGYALGLPVIWLVALLAGAVGGVAALVVVMRRSPR